VFAMLVASGGGWAADAPLWTTLVALVAVVASATLASYLPPRGHGRFQRLSRTGASCPA